MSAWPVTRSKRSPSRPRPANPSQASGPGLSPRNPGRGFAKPQPRPPGARAKGVFTMSDMRTRQRRELIVTFVLAFLLGSGIFVGLLFLLGGFLIAVLATLGVLFVLGLFHFFVW